MLHLNNKHDVDKLQKLENRCLRMCFDVINPRDVTVQRLHEMAYIKMLDTRRDIQLLNIMFNLKQCGCFRKRGTRITRSTDKYVFDTDIVHLGIYAKSPYYMGVRLWSDLPANWQNTVDKYTFSNIIKNHIAWTYDFLEYAIHLFTSRCWVQLC